MRVYKKVVKIMSNFQDDHHQDLLAKYDKESAYRTNLQKWAWVVSIVAISLTVFQLYTAFRGPYVSLIQGAIHLGSALGLIFILYPIKRSMLMKKGVPWYDVVLALLAMFSSYYIVFNYSRLVKEAIIRGYTDLDTIVAIVGVLLLLEATRRAVGLPIVVIASIAIAYALWGKGIPYFGHAGFNFDRLVSKLFYSTEAIFGIPIQISSTYIFLFLFFGVMLTKTGIGQFFNDIAFGATGRMTGGTAKAAVAASALQGMVTGSSVANTVGSGSFTIPMMKRAGFKPEFAAATEAAASTGGQIMPPIMGAAAFIMAEYTNTEYSTIMLIAIIPALLYFSGVFIGTHFEAKKQGILGLPKEQLPRFKHLVKRFDLFLPLLAIIGLLLFGFTATTAALWGIGAAFVVSLYRKDTRMSPRNLLDAFEQGARVALPVIAACATAGIIVGVVVTTGLGGKIAGSLISIAGDNLFLLLFFTMLACLVLGMGLPTTANYVVTATMAAPALIMMDVPVLAAHFFVFYFGIVADITPPVCLAAYAGAGIARANPLKSGVTAVKLAIAAFIIPYTFVYNPVLVLQDWTWATLLPPLITALFGMAAISTAMIGFYVIKTNIFERVLLIGSGVMLVYPKGILISGLGLALFVIIGVIQKLKKNRLTLA